MSLNLQVPVHRLEAAGDGRQQGREARALPARLPAVLLLAHLLLGCPGSESPPRAETAAPEDPRAALVAIPETDLGRLEEAIREALEGARAELEAVRGRPDAGDAELGRAFGALGRHYFAHRLLEPAEACFRNAVALAPAELRWHYYLGQLHRARGRAAEARRSFERAAALRPGDLPTQVALGELYLGEGRLDAAESRFAAALEIDGSCAAARAGLGRVARERGDFQAAIHHLEAALAEQPEASALHYPLALAYRELGDLERSRAHLAERGDGAVRLADPLMDEVRSLATGARVHLLRAGSALAAGELERAAGELRQAVAADPEDASARVTLGAVLAQQGETGEARKQFAAALRIDPTDARAHYDLGLLSLGEGSEAEAIEHFRTALEHDPVHESARFWEAAALIRAGRWADARERLDGAVERLPESGRLAHLLARLLAAAPDPDARDGERALALATELARRGGLFEGRLNADHGQTLAMAYAETGHFDRAVELQRALIRAMERDGEHERLSWVRENLARYERREPYRATRPEHDPVLSPVASIDRDR